MSTSQSDHRSDTGLPADMRHLHRTLLNSLLATGEVPSLSVLAADLGIGQKALAEQLQTLAQGDYLAFDGPGCLTCLYPYSVDPTPHVVTIDGQRRFAMCSLDALGMAAMLDRAVDIESACPVCERPIHLAVRPGAVTTVEPAATMVVAGRDGDAPAYEACCGFTVFACGTDHADALIARTADTSALDLPTALDIGETLFAGMLDATLPRSRTRAPHFAEGM